VHDTTMNSSRDMEAMDRYTTAGPSPHTSTPCPCLPGTQHAQVHNMA
jgi:hypothetical protein